MKLEWPVKKIADFIFEYYIENYKYNRESIYDNQENLLNYFGGASWDRAFDEQDKTFKTIYLGLLAGAENEVDGCEFILDEIDKAVKQELSKIWEEYFETN
jgi:hypothetical protein